MTFNFNFKDCINCWFTNLKSELKRFLIDVHICSIYIAE